MGLIRPNTWNQQILKIENAGFAAQRDGRDESECPYQDGYRNQNGAGGQLQKLRRQAWLRGFEIAQKEP